MYKVEKYLEYVFDIKAQAYSPGKGGFSLFLFLLLTSN